MAQVRQQGLAQSVGLGLSPSRAINVEVAVGANAGAVRPVDVEADVRQVAGDAQNRAAFSWAKATARWLIACLAAGSISPKVSASPARVKIGS